MLLLLLYDDLRLLLYYIIITITLTYYRGEKDNRECSDINFTRR